MKPQVISFHCILRNHLGEILSSSYNGEVVTNLQTRACKTEPPGKPRPRAPSERDIDSGHHLRGLIKGLEGLKPGERRQIFVPAAEAYGFYDKALVIDVPSEDFPDEELPRLGAEIFGEFQDGTPRVFRVIDVTRGFVTLDANHPLAGQDLIFDIEATDVREATAEDVSGDDITFSPLGYLH